MQLLNLNSLTWTRLAIAVCVLGMAGMLAGCGISGYQTAVNRVVVPGGATQSVHVNCPAGKRCWEEVSTSKLPTKSKYSPQSQPTGMAMSLITAGT